MTDTNDIPTTEHEPFDVDQQIQRLLAKNRQIAAIWCIKDVQEIRPDLTDDQAWEVLEEVANTHDADIGINWATLEIIAHEIFPDPRAE